MEFGKQTTAVVLMLAIPVAGLFCVGCSGTDGSGYVQYGQIDPPPTPSEPAPAGSATSVTGGSASVASEEGVGAGAVVGTAEDVVSDQTTQPVVQTVSSTNDESNVKATVMPGNEPSENTEAASEAIVPSVAGSSDGDVAAIGPDGAGVENQLPTEPREIKLLISEKRLLPEGDSKALRLTYDDIDLLKILNMEPVPTNADTHFPQWLNDLSGQRIRIRGFMYPTFEATGLTAFTMARDNGICCFVRQPKIYDIIGITLADGETTDYIEGKPFDVEGVFQIAPEADDTELYQLYRIADAKVLK
ncbi:MAG: hypothetical protein GY758_07295 [Fuerstiella sp.]|jgi:hypothetical protein|nr:hypothetical protein [Fuerstiella sp.]MDG2126986.1 hypothetical protein [Fuerstiella sp.]